MFNKRFFSVIIFLFFVFIPTLSFADDYIEESDDTAYSEVEVSTDVSNVPNINARHAVVFDRASGTVLFGKNENEKCKMASTTKIMTAVVVLENCNNLKEIVTVSSKAARNWRVKIGVIHK